MALTARQQAIQEMLATIDRLTSLLAAEKIRLAGLENEQESRS